MFLERGLDGASIDEIARAARAGKATIYARFPTKEALFTEVAMRNAARVRTGFEAYVPAGATIEDRLANTATEILRRLLISDVLSFMRLCVAEAHRFPKVAGVGRMVRERAAAAVAQILSDLAQTDEIGKLSAFAPERIAETAQLFMDVVVQRLLMRGLFGENPVSLQGEIEGQARRSVRFFLAACRGA